MHRITNKDLERLCERINDLTGSPKTGWTKKQDGGFVANIGHYYIDGAYGGVALERMVTDGGGVEAVFSCGHVTKRDLYNRMHAFLDGFEAATS